MVLQWGGDKKQVRIGLCNLVWAGIFSINGINALQ